MGLACAQVSHGFQGLAGRLHRELIEFVGQRAELALVRQALAGGRAQLGACRYANG